MFRTQYDRVKVTTDPGSRFEPTYSPKVSKDGSIDLVESGKIDTYEQIQSWRESCDMQEILTRYLNGDQTALSRHTPLFGDFSDAPSSLADYYQRILDAEEAFMRLPVDTRAEFNHSPSEFFASIGSEKFNSIMGIAPLIDDQQQVSESMPTSEPAPKPEGDV